MNCIKEKKEKLLSLFQQGFNAVLQQQTEIRQKAIELGNLLIEKISPLFNQFKEYGCKYSALFAFWNEYMEMVWLLLNFIHGDRDSNWLLHLEVFSAMLPYDRAFDHLNYFGWGTVYSLLNGYEDAARGCPQYIKSLLRIEPMLFQHHLPRHRSILSHQTCHWSRQWTDIPKPKEELLELLAWRAQEIGGHLQLI